MVHRKKQSELAELGVPQRACCRPKEYSPGPEGGKLKGPLVVGTLILHPEEREQEGVSR